MSAAPSPRRWDRKNWTIVFLVALVLGMTVFAFRDAIAARGWFSGGEGVRVVEVLVDRDGHHYVDFIFDQSIAEGRVGELPGEAPATIAPELPGKWRWRDVAVLRFEPDTPFPPGSRFSFGLVSSRVVPEGQRLAGKKRFEVTTDTFRVVKVDVSEEPTGERRGEVTLSGEIHFNYEVDPEKLAPFLRLEDRSPGPAGAPEAMVGTTYHSEVIRFQTTAVQKGDREREVVLVVDGKLLPVGGSGPLGNPYRRAIPLGAADQLTVREVSAEPALEESSLRIVFSGPIDAVAIEKFVRLAPAKKLRLTADRNVLTVRGDLAPGNSYELVLSQGLPGTDGATLQQEYKKSVPFSDLGSTVGFQSEGMFLAREGYQTVNLETVNTERVTLTIDRAYRNNLFFLLQYGGLFDGYGGGYLSHHFGDRVADEVLDLSKVRNQRVLTPLQLAPYVEGKGPGIYRVAITEPGEWETQDRWLLLTDLGVVAKRGGGELVVWAASLKTLAPAAGAKVTLLSDQNQPLASGTTDGGGFWRTSLPTPDAKGQPYLVTVEKGGDFSFLLFDQMMVDTTGLDVDGAPATPAAGYNAFLYGERDLYRPGETARGLAIVRDETLAAPGQVMPAVLTHRDPEGRELATQTVEISAEGLVALEAKLPERAGTGTHTLDLTVAERSLGQWLFSVEEFVPDRIKVELAAAEGAAVPKPGVPFTYRVSSAYLFGAPAAELAFSTRVRLVDATFSAPSFPEFTFRNRERTWSDREILTQDGRLDNQGEATLSAPVPERMEAPSSLTAIVTARVSEQGGRGVSGRAVFAVHPVPYYVGLRQSTEGYAEPGKDFAFEYLAVTPEGVTTQASELRVELFRDRWNTVLRRTGSGGYRYETNRNPELVSSQRLAPGSGRGTFRVRPPGYGSYRVVITDPATRASSSREFYSSGWGYSPWAIKNPALLELDLDRDEYAPGDTATVQVRAPFAGKLIVTVERDRVLDTQVHTLTGNTGTVQIPIRGEYRPNAYVTATLVRAIGDLTPGTAGRAYGAIPLPVDRAANHLVPEITTPEESRSGKELTFGVTTEPGATVTVAAVDEGILQLIAQETPDPFPFFYRQLALGVSTFDTFALMLPEIRGTAAAGGGEGLMNQGSVRTESLRRVEPVTYWSGPLTAGPDGRVTARFQLPEEFQGALRVMAVAVEGKKVGSSAKGVRVRDPLVLLPTAPRVLSFGERLQVPVTVRNDTGRAGTFKVSLETTGPGTVEGEATQALEVPNGSERTVYLGVRTGDTSGVVTMKVQAAGNGERAKATIHVPVRPDLPALAEGTGAALTERVTSFGVRAPERYRPETVTRELRLGALPVIQFSGQLANLLEYPYGCLEQTVSRAFPLLYLADLARELDPEVLDPKKGRGDPEVWVADAIRRVSLQQHYAGGFTLWPGQDEPNPWASVYATHFLVEAKRAGYEVNENLLSSAFEYVTSLVQGQGNGPEGLERAAYGLFVLARGGAADVGTMDRIRDQHGAKLRPETKALLAGAYAAHGDKNAARTLITNLGDVETIERSSGGNWTSTLRNRAIVLLGTLDAAPGSAEIPRLVDRLSRDAGAVSGWWTTHESGWVFVALGQFVKEQKAKGPFAGTVYLGSRSLGRFSSAKPAVFGGLTGNEPLRVELDAGDPAGAAFYSLITRGVPTDTAYSPTQAGLEIERRVLSREGKPVDLTRVAQGDLLVVETWVRSKVGAVENVAVVNLLPSGLEVENPRLTTTETLPWVEATDFEPDYTDLRDDRFVLFTDLAAVGGVRFYTLVRAVAPGSFRLPPVAVEAMYNPALSASGERGTVEVSPRRP